MWTYTLYFVSLLVGVFGISVHNGRYEDINIIIQDSVAESETLLNRIQEVFTEASQLLFEATNHHVHFGKINILLPKKWTVKPEYIEISARSELETYITVEDGKIRIPFTNKKNHGCGLPGLFIYFPVKYLLASGRTFFGNCANVLVHEWGHYRWGLYDEYAMRKDRFYMKDGEWKPARCSESVTGKVGKGRTCRTSSKCDTSKTTKYLNKRCKFCPDIPQNIIGLGSIMAFNWLDEVTMFCDNQDDVSVPKHQHHNRDARNKQNIMCNRRSAWEVMRDHDDFKSVPLAASTNTTPEFTILQESTCYRVFVLDVSESMSDTRINTLYQSSKYIIETLITDESWLGIVWFSSSAATKKDMTQITSQNTRNDLVAALPTYSRGGTCIGCGIEEALQMLTTLLGDPAGSAIIVISDGDNKEGNLSTSIQMAIDARVIIHTLSVSQDADESLISMATETGGVHVSYLEGNISFVSAFMEVLPCGLTSYASELTTLLSEKLDTTPSTNTSFTFDIDSSVGKGTKIGLLLHTSADISIEVSGPDGTKYTEKANGYSIVLILPDTVVIGQYDATVITSPPSTFEYYVTSLPKDPEPLRVSSYVYPTNADFSKGELPVIFADVTKGRAPVLGVDVMAVAETGTKSCNVTLLDNGADPDYFPDDGTYSGVIPRSCLSNGRIATKVYARGENGIAMILNDINGAGSPYSDEDSNNTEVLGTSFQRVTVSNEILVTNFVDEDIIGPGRITDVEIVDIVDIVTVQTKYGESRNFTITWTATGDDVNIGQATEYEMRISKNQSVLSNTFSFADLLDVVNANFTPKEAGVTEAIKIEVDAEKSFVSTVYFGVRAKDDAGNAGHVSNIISIVVAEGYRLKFEADVEVVYTNDDDDYDYDYDYDESVIEEEKEEDLEGKEENVTGLATGLSATVTGIIIVITLIATC